MRMDHEHMGKRSWPWGHTRNRASTSTPVTINPSKSPKFSLFVLAFHQDCKQIWKVLHSTSTVKNGVYVCVCATVPVLLLFAPSSDPICSYFCALSCVVVSMRDQLCHRCSSWAFKCNFCCSSCLRSETVVDTLELSSVINKTVDHITLQQGSIACWELC